MTERDVSEFMSEDHREACLVRQYIDQSFAEDYRMPDRERFEGRRHEDPRSDFGNDVEVVRDFKVRDNGLQHLVNFTLRRDQRGLLQTPDDVVFCLPLPGAQFRYR